MITKRFDTADLDALFAGEKTHLMLIRSDVDLGARDTLKLIFRELGSGRLYRAEYTHNKGDKYPHWCCSDGAGLTVECVEVERHTRTIIRYVPRGEDDDMTDEELAMFHNATGGDVF